MSTLSLDRVAADACSLSSSRRYLAAENKRLLAELTNARDQHARFIDREAAVAAREQKVSRAEISTAAALAEANVLKDKWQKKVDALKDSLADTD
jgi:hypothetical protein